MNLFRKLLILSSSLLLIILFQNCAEEIDLTAYTDQSSVGAEDPLDEDEPPVDENPPGTQTFTTPLITLDNLDYHLHSSITPNEAINATTALAYCRLQLGEQATLASHQMKTETEATPYIAFLTGQSTCVTAGGQYINGFCFRFILSFNTTRYESITCNREVN